MHLTGDQLAGLVLQVELDPDLHARIHLLDTQEDRAAIVAQRHSADLQRVSVLLAPACASFDMFDGFAERGRAFQDAVAEVVS